MPNAKLFNTNILNQELLPTPEQVHAEVPLTEAAENTVQQGREQLRKILRGEDNRIFVVVGPCSIHDVGAAKEYANRLKELATRVSDTLLVIMRVYFEKPRTTVGWKGFINDPDMDDSFKIGEGLVRARRLLCDLAQDGLATGTEALDPITPQYLADLISWYAIGARTTESQKHREMSSGLSAPVGFKNGTDGSISVAINAICSAQHSHHFLGITQDGRCAVFHTAGNPHTHVVLRGGGRPNYDSVSVAQCEEKLRAAELPRNIMIDCSHGNSLKDHTVQPLVLDNCCNQIVNGNSSIVGFMLESNLREGNQSINGGESPLEYGVSVTDACMSWEQTEEALMLAYQKLKPVLPSRDRSQAL